MTNTEPTVSAKPRGKIKQTLASEPWVRAMRLIIAAVSLFLLYRIALKFHEGHLTHTDAWLVGMVGTLGLSALVEAIWPEGNHGLLQFWCLTSLAAGALVSWEAGGERWLGIAGAILLGLSFFIAVLSSARGPRSNAR